MARNVGMCLHLCRNRAVTIWKPLNSAGIVGHMPEKDPDAKYMAKRNMVFKPNPTKFCALTTKADYSFVDGRPSPLGRNLKRRLSVQRGYAEKIVQLTKEIDFAVENYNMKQKEAQETKQKILDSKLKPKGKTQL